MKPLIPARRADLLRPLFALVLAFVLSTGVAPARASKVEAMRLADRHDSAVVQDHYGIGIDIESRIVDDVYAYDANTDTWLMKVQVDWRGPLTGESYWARGMLEVGPRGWSWEQNAVNDNLRGWLLLRGLFEAVVAVRGSDVAGPVLAKYPDGYYEADGQRLRLFHSRVRMAPARGSAFPAWSDVEDHGRGLDGKCHVAGSAYYYSLLEPGELLTLKVRNTTRNSFSARYIYRTKLGKFYHRGTGGSGWEELRFGATKTYFVQWGGAKIGFDFQRPNSNHDSKGREVDYRFRVSEVDG